MNKKSIFIGLENVAGNIYHIANALRTVGVDAKSYSFKQHSFGYQQDVLLKLWRPNKKHKLFQKLYINKYTIKWVNAFLRFYYFLSLLDKYEEFFFVSRFTFFKNNTDLKILKLLNKKTYIFFTGCPERDPYDQINNRDGGICRTCDDEGKKKFCKCYQPRIKEKMIRNIEKHSEIIFAHRDTTGFLFDREKVKKIYLISESMSDDTNNKFSNIVKINIAHFPSNRLLKGTKYVEAAIEEISNKKIKYISKRVQNSELLKILEKTHILIDQFGPGPGLLAVEAMSRGCVVICRLAKWFKEDYPDIPIVSCEPEELKEVLEDLINNPEKMKSIAHQSIQYYKKYHTPEAVGNYYKKILNLH